MLIMVCVVWMWVVVVGDRVSGVFWVICMICVVESGVFSRMVLGMRFVLVLNKVGNIVIGGLVQDLVWWFDLYQFVIFQDCDL